MKQKNNIILLAGVAFITAVIAFVISSTIFKGPTSRSTKVPAPGGNIEISFPDIKHDSAYNAIFNTSAVDPAVPLTPTTTPNNQPFNTR